MSLVERISRNESRQRRYEATKRSFLALASTILQGGKAGLHCLNHLLLDTSIRGQGTCLHC